MNSILDRLQPYPFERLRQLFADITPSPAHRPISLGIGEPRHAMPAFVAEVMAAEPKATPERVLFTARRYVSNGHVPDLTHIVYVDPIGTGFCESTAGVLGNFGRTTTGGIANG